MFDDLPQVTPLTGVCRENAKNKLARVRCPHCATEGKYSLFNKAMHVGVQCDACGTPHPLSSRGIKWLPSIMNAWKRGKL